MDRTTIPIHHISPALAGDGNRVWVDRDDFYALTKEKRNQINSLSMWGSSDKAAPYADMGEVSSKPVALLMSFEVANENLAALVSALVIG